MEDQPHNIFGKRYEVLKKAFNFTLNSSLQPFTDEALIQSLFGSTFSNIDDIKVIMEKFKDVCKNSISEEFDAICMTNEINIQLDRLDQILNEWKSEDIDKLLKETGNHDENVNSSKDERMKTDDIKSLYNLINSINEEYENNKQKLLLQREEITTLQKKIEEKKRILDSKISSLHKKTEQLETIESKNLLEKM